MQPTQTVDLAEAEQKQNRRKFMRRYWIFFGIAGFLVVMGLIDLYYRTQKVSAPRIDDTTYVTQANAVCKKYVPKLIAQQPQKDEQLNNAQMIPRIRTSADTMQLLRNELGTLTPAAASQADVSTWLAYWDKYIAAGRSYADALQENDKSAYTKIGNQSSLYSERITAFAVENKIKDCVLQTQQPAMSGF